MMPPKEDLSNCESLSIAARKYGVSERTIRRWLAAYGIYHPRQEFGPRKLGKDKAEEIRAKFAKGVPAKELAKSHGVTLTCIYKVLGHKTYKRENPSAVVFVVYNPL